MGLNRCTGIKYTVFDWHFYKNSGSERCSGGGWANCMLTVKDPRSYSCLLYISFAARPLASSPPPHTSCSCGNEEINSLSIIRSETIPQLCNRVARAISTVHPVATIQYYIVYTPHKIDMKMYRWNPQISKALVNALLSWDLVKMAWSYDVTKLAFCSSLSILILSWIDRSRN